MASLVDGIPLRMVGRGQHTLDPQRAHQFPPDIPHKFETTIGQEAARCAEVRYDMPKEGITHRACCVIAHRNKNCVPRIAINKHDEKLMSVIGGKGTHNVDRERIPWTSGLYGTCRLYTMAIIAPQLTLWATLGNLYAQAASGLIGVSVAKKLSQRLAAQMCRRMQLLRQPPSLLIAVYLDMKQRILGWCRSYWQPAEPINVGLSLPRTMTDGKIVLLQCR